MRNILIFVAVVFVVALAGFVGTYLSMYHQQKTATPATVHQTVATRAAATPHRAPAIQPTAARAPVIATPAQTDACKDAIMGDPANKLTERKARHLAAGTTFTYNGITVTANDKGIWGGCQAALSDTVAIELAAVNAESQSLATTITTLTADSQTIQVRLNDARTKQTAALARKADLERQIAARTAAQTAPTAATRTAQPHAAAAPQAVTAARPASRPHAPASPPAH